jgi:diaminopimelate decarboxylase
MSATPHAPISGFAVRGNELCINGVPLTQLAARVGQTPFYAYDRALLTARVARLRQMLPPGISLHYAMKANPMPALVGCMAALVDGLDVASGGELRVALDAGMAPRDISFAGPGKSMAELRQAVASGILVNLESTREVPLLAETSAQLGMPARVAVRVNPAYELKASGMKMGGGPKQFGIDAEQVPAVLADIGHHRLAFEGFHIFSGSQSLRADAICEAQTKAFELAALATWAPTPVTTLSTSAAASAYRTSPARSRSNSRRSAPT